jgi:hypothetical protein
MVGVIVVSQRMEGVPHGSRAIRPAKHLRDPAVTGDAAAWDLPYNRIYLFVEILRRFLSNHIWNSHSYSPLSVVRTASL